MSTKASDGARKGVATVDQALAVQGAEVLFALRWGQWGPEDDEQEESVHPAATKRRRNASPGDEQNNGVKRPRGTSAAPAPAPAKPKSMQTTATATPLQVKKLAPQKLAPPADAASSSGDEGDAQPFGRVQRQTDKEWAALTTWMRMNLHHPRTQKRQILFLGEKDMANGRWVFKLNPAVSWDDVSDETKVRLKTIVLETEETFAAKYPHRARGDWVNKIQKYKAPGADKAVPVTLGELVKSLEDIYNLHELGQAPKQQQEQQQQQAEGGKQQQVGEQNLQQPGNESSGSAETAAAGADAAAAAGAAAGAGSAAVESGPAAGAGASTRQLQDAAEQQGTTDSPRSTPSGSLPAGPSPAAGSRGGSRGGDGAAAMPAGRSNKAAGATAAAADDQASVAPSGDSARADTPDGEVWAASGQQHAVARAVPQPC